LPPGWLPYSHLEAIQKNIDLYRRPIFCDQNNDNLRKIQSTLGGGGYYENYEALLEQEKPDIVSIATRAKGRVEIIRSAINNGVKGFYIEKPIARSMLEVGLIKEMLLAGEAKISYGTQRRFMSLYRKVKKIIDDDLLGEVKQIHIGFGKAPLFWVHPHSIDMMFYYANSTHVESVQASLTTKNSDINDLVEDSDPIVNYAVINFSNGIQGIISSETSISGMNVAISGEKGNIYIFSNGSKCEMHEKYFFNDCSYPTMKVTDISNESEMSGTYNSFRELGLSVKDNKVSPYSIDEIENAMAVLIGLYESSIRGGIKFDPKDVRKSLYITGRIGNLYP